jgi:hypothetical protein
LDDVTEQYNASKHRTIGMRPKDVKRSSPLLTTAYNHIKIAGINRFSVGDIVRISKYKSLFEKGYTPNWSTELFKIIKVQITNPATYLLEDILGNPIQGSFYQEELQKVKHKDVYLVEKELRRRGRKVYVKWLGLDKSHNSWINKSDIV